MKNYRALSPDGFDIEMDSDYKSVEEAEQALNEFVKRYKFQGYYHTANRDTISLDEIRNHCKIIEV